MSTLMRVILSTFFALSALSMRAQTSVPINVQGRVTTNGLVFNGIGKFKFAFVLANGRFVLWTNDGLSGGIGFEPAASIDLNVVKGLYSVQLGDTNVAGMSNPINPDIFTNSDVRLRIWFNDSVNGFQMLQPDERVGAVGYAMNAQRANQAAVLTGSVTIGQVPSILITNNSTDVTLTGSFTGDGSGLTGIRGSTPFQIANSDTNNAVPNTGYLITNVLQRVVLLPTTATLKVGDIVRVAGSGSWKVAQQSDQSIFASHFRGGLGATWVPHDSNRNWTSIASSTNGINQVAVVYNGLIYLSTNGGFSWTPPPVSPSKKWLTVSSSGDGQRLLAGTENDFLYVSTDAGQSWTSRSQPGARLWNGVASSLDGTNLVAVAGGSGPVFTSADGGDTWFAKSAAGQRNWTGVASSGDGTDIFAASATGLAGSSDKGVSWTNLFGGSFTAVACSQDGQRVISALATGGVTNIYTSADGGTNWIKRDGAGSKLWRDITCSADGTVIAITAADGIYISVDGGGAWAPHAQAANWQGITCSADAQRFSAVVFGGQVYTSVATTLRTTTPGANGYLAGGEYSAVELQHVGSGQFMPLSSSGSIFAY